MADEFSHEAQAKRLYGLGELEKEALEVLRLIVRQTERGEKFLMLMLPSERRRLLIVTTAR